MDPNDDPDTKEALKQAVIKKQKTTPKIMFNNILSSILNDPRVLTWIIFFGFNSTLFTFC
jgi:hypothetical protein